MKKIILFIGMTIALHTVFASTQYVAPSGNDTNDGSSWATAKQTIQAGVDAASAREVVWVTNGVYSTGGRVQSGYNLMTRVLATNGVIIRSINGPTQTIIDGGGAPFGSTNAVRPVLLDAGSRLEGFTLIGGSTRTNGIYPNDDTGGGLFVGYQSWASNCIIKQCTAMDGGGVYVNNLNIERTMGITHCQIISNSATGGGGGVLIQSDTAGGYVLNCVIQYNTSDHGGGGMIYHVGVMCNCLITDNASTNNGGGVFIDCGSNGAYVENCTITRNWAPAGGGIGYIINGATVKNTIIFENTAANWDGGSYEYSCLTPAASGTGNITNNPLFVDRYSGNFRLAAGSPCINAGTNLTLTTYTMDMDDNPRVVNDRVDIGAYESQSIPLPSVPTGVSASDGTYTNKVRITWITANDATGYQLFRNTINSSNDLPVFATTTATNYDDNSASAGSNYYYWVKATNTAGASEFSSGDVGYSAIPLTGGIQFTMVATSVNENAGSVYLTVTRTGGSAGAARAICATTNGTAIADTDYTTTIEMLNWTDGDDDSKTFFVPIINRSGTQTSRVFTVSLIWASGVFLGSSTSITVTITDVLSAPSVPTDVSASDDTYTNKVRITWSAVSNATSYRIFQSTSNNSASANQIGTATSTTYDDTAAVAATTYYYWVKAVNTAGASDFSASDTGRRAPTVLAPVASSVVSASDGTYTDKVEVTWSTVSEATSYEVWRSTVNNSNSAIKLAEVAPGLTAMERESLTLRNTQNQPVLAPRDGSTAYDDTDASAGVVYYYWVKTKRVSDVSEFSQSDSGYRKAGLTPPAIVEASDGTYSNSVRVVWPVVTGATSYEVWRSAVNVSAFATLLSEVSELEYNDTAAHAGTIYYYWIKSKNAQEISAFSRSDAGYCSREVKTQPRATINGASGEVTLHKGDTLSVEIFLMTTSRLNADWWAVIAVPGGAWYYFDAYTGGWNPISGELTPTYQGPLFDFLAPIEILNMSTTWLPTGAYVFYFGIDTAMNGDLDSPPILVFDSTTMILAE